MRAVGYAYPWDYLDDPAAAPRAASLGLDAVALAASYHATRAASPLHPRRRVFDAPHSALYVPRREDAWRGRRLAPRAATWLEEPDAFGVATRRLVAEGLTVEAWIVLAHDDDLGRGNPDLVVRSAFGDAYPYALCPWSEEVREYCATLAEEVVATTLCDGVVLEACGPMGVEHAGVHDKTDFARWDATTRRLLSLCFCAHCAGALAAAGLDVEELSRLVRDGVSSGADSVEEALGEDLAATVAALRAGGARALRRDVTERVRALREVRVTLHASGTRWTSGSFCALGDGDALEDVDALVADAWDLARAEEEVAALAARAGGHALGAYLRLDRDGASGPAFSSTLARYGALGVDEAHLYHLGLVGQDGLDLVREVTGAGRP